MQQDNQYLIDILHAAQRILEYTADTSLHGFYEDVQLQDKVVCRLLTIGKTAQRISPVTRHEMTDVAWSQLDTMKERLLEEDPVIDVDQVWHITQGEMVTLVRSLESTILPESEDSFSFSGVTSY